MRLMRALLQLLLSAWLILIANSSAWAQITNVTNDQATPIPGAGHDYIKMLSETVSPANGQVSVRIDMPTPRGRLLNIPFALLYNSSGVHHVGYNVNGTAKWWTDTGQDSGSGWTYALPYLTAIQGQRSTYNPNTYPPATYTCEFISNYVLQDLAGTRHTLNISIAQVGAGSTHCDLVASPPFNFLSGGDDFLRATTSAPCQGCTQFIPQPVAVADADGTVYYFSTFGFTHANPNINGYYSWPTYIKDRNGNIINVSSSGGATTVTDTLGRTAVSISPINSGTNANTVTISGLANPYTVQWQSVPSSFNVGQVEVESPRAPNCQGIQPNTSGTTVVQSLTLPNGQTYQFQYDGTYGLLSKVTYPTGGYVSYTWGLNPLSESTSFPNADGGSTCIYRYDSPVITNRYVSFDGVNIALQQDFSYSTNWSSSTSADWTSKQTAVTTRDLIRGQSYQTVYAYAPFTVFAPPNARSCWSSSSWNS